MLRLLKWLGWVVGALVLLLVLVVGGVWAGANTSPGRRLIERETASLTSGTVTLAGLSGQFPQALRIARIELRDPAGAWLTINDLALDWSPLALFSREALINRLDMAHITVARSPAPSPPTKKPAATSSSYSLPVRVVLRSLHVGQLDVEPAVAGHPASVTADGSADIASRQQGEAQLAIRGLNAPGAYKLEAHLAQGQVSVHLTADEPPHGLIGGVAGLPDLGALGLQATLAGPTSALNTNIDLSAGPLRASVKGEIDVDHSAARLAVTANAPSMHPRPDVSWQSVAVDATVAGPFSRPDANAKLRINGLSAAGAAIGAIAADVNGNAGQVALRASFDQVRVPGPKPDLLATAPLTLTAEAKLSEPDRPVTFHLQHPLIDAIGQATIGSATTANVTLTLPDLAPFAAAGGTELAGHTTLSLKANVQGQTTTADLDGAISITGGMAPVPALLGEDAKISTALTMQGSNIDLHHLDLHGKTLDVSAKGHLTNQVLDLDWRVALAELAAVAPSVSGKVEASGHVAGPETDLAVDANVNGDVAAPDIPPGPVHATLHAKGLPTAPSGQLTADGTLLGAPLTLALAADRAADGSMHLAIDKADWKSAHAQGAFTLAKGATLPIGKLALAMRQLDDLRPFVGKPLTGSINANAETTEHEAKLDLEAQKAGLPGSASIGRATLTATVQEPTTKPVVDARLNVEGAEQGAMLANARLEVKGPQDALAMRLTANARNVAGSTADLTTAALVNAVAKDTTVSSLEAVWKGQTLRLLGPARINFADGITVDRLRLGLQQASLEVAGRASPALDLTVALRNVTPSLAAAFVPGLAADGSLRADAKLTGSTARPNGTIRVEATGLRMRTGPGASLPPANLIAAADLAAGQARINTRLTAGSATSIALTGSAPVSAAAGALDLHLDGRIDLTMLDPITMANGERVRGIVTTRLTISGTMSAPKLGGTVQLARGEVQDFAQGAHLTDINATINAEGDTIRIARLDARAAPGTMSVTGTVGALTPGIPIDLVIKAHNARPLASDRLTVNLNLDLTVRGRVSEQMMLAGLIHINRAEIGIPETMPASVSVLNVRMEGQPPPPPPKPGPLIGLNLTLEAPRQIWVRGRGLEAELGGTIHVHGTSAKPEPDGSFDMIRGQLSLAGTTLTFTKGEVGFNGGTLADPSIDFVATSTNGTMTASLEISGTASKPKITLSSTPELPQDQVLAQLLFGKPLSSLSPFEMASMAAALAQLSGATGGAGGGPLEDIRKSLGLQQLSVGSSSSGGAALQAGRYVAPGVFVGAKQGTATNSTQGLVQVDLYKGLKLQGTVGTGSNQTPGANPEDSAGSSLGLKYQLDY